jgi:periplasmic divalent cation tolerance protein
MPADGETYALITTTAADRAQADNLARMLIDRRLAACVQLLPIDSLYRWRGEVEAASEILLLIKTRQALVEAAMAALKADHAYETPEIVVLPIQAGLPAYLAWIDAETGPA